MAFRDERIFDTGGRGTVDITDFIADAAARSGLETGVATVFVHHTSASLFVNENADPDVRRDLEAFLSRLVPDGDPLYVHTAEGPDDMSAHVRTLLTCTSLAVPLCGGRLDLGTWQGVFLWEHRHRPHRRRVSVTVTG
jgi:secondary thiamine-phosphate synthase enzyme